MDVSRRTVLAGGLAVALKPENPLVAGTVLRRAAIRSPNFVTGVSGWTINQDGSAEFNNVVIRNGQVVSGTALFYSGPPAAGSLIASVAAIGGVDPFGNHYVQGVADYLLGVAAAASSGGIVVFHGSLAGGWTAGASLTDDSLGGIVAQMSGQTFNITGGGLFQVNGSEAIIGTGAALLKVTETGGAPAGPPTQLIAKTAGDRALGIEVTGDTAFRYRVDSNGRTDLGNGTVTDVHTLRAAAGVFAINGTPGSLVIGADAETTTAALEVQGGPVALQARAAPATPAAGFGFVYASSADGLLHQKDAAGFDGTVPGTQADSTNRTVTQAVATQLGGQFFIPANPAVGSCFRYHCGGTGTWGSTQQQLTLIQSLAGVNVNQVNVAATAFAASDPVDWDLWMQVVIKSTGVGGTCACRIALEISKNNAAANSNNGVAAVRRAAGVAIDTTASRTLELDALWAATTGAPTISGNDTTYERVGP